MPTTNRGVVSAGIMAGGRGTRLGLAVSESKACIIVGGRPLVDYVLEDLAASGVSEVAFAVDADDRQLAVLLESEGRFRKVERLDQHGDGTLGAVLELLRALGGRDHLISTCDTIAPRHTVPRLISAAKERAHQEPLMVLAATTYANDDQPIWIHAADDGSVSDMGKGLRSTGLAFANIRWVSRGVRDAIDNSIDPLVTRDSELMSWIARTFPGRVFAVDVGTVIDVDTHDDLAAAERLVSAIRR